MINVRSGWPPRTWKFVETRQFDRGVDRLGARVAEEHTGRRDWGELDELVGEVVGRPIREWIEGGVGGQRAGLSVDRLGDFLTPVADRAVPEAPHPVDVFLAVGVPHERTLTSRQRDELLAGGSRHRMKK